MIDFTDMPKRKKSYAGANGSKISIIYNGEQYMLKFPALATRNQEIIYSNSCISEYLGCEIYESVGIPVQKTVLGTYTTEKSGKKVVVACKDFTSFGVVLQDFASLKNQIIDSERNGYGTDLEDLTSVFMKQTALDPAEISERFWDMFIIDALIGNWDRHNGNWGFLYDTKNDSLVLAPVFDCGSSLYPQADESMIEKVLNSRQEIHHRVFNIPVSAIQFKGKKINYYEFVSSLQNEECNRALERLVPRIDMKRIDKIVDEIPIISDRQKIFYKTMLSERMEKILDFSFRKLCK